MRGIHLYWKRKRSITWGMLHVSHILSHVKCTSVLKVDYVTLDPYPRQSDFESQAFGEGWSGCGRDLITEVGIVAN